MYKSHTTLRFAILVILGLVLGLFSTGKVFAQDGEDTGTEETVVDDGTSNDPGLQTITIQEGDESPGGFVNCEPNCGDYSIQVSLDGQDLGAVTVGDSGYYNYYNPAGGGPIPGNYTFTVLGASGTVVTADQSYSAQSGPESNLNFTIQSQGGNEPTFEFPEIPGVDFTPEECGQYEWPTGDMEYGQTQGCDRVHHGHNTKIQILCTADGSGILTYYAAADVGIPQPEGS